MEQFNPIFGESSLAFQIISSVPKSTANCTLYNNPMQCLINTQDLEFCNIHLFVLHEFQKQRPQWSIIFDMNDLNARATEMYIYILYWSFYQEHLGGINNLNNYSGIAFYVLFITFYTKELKKKIPKKINVSSIDASTN